MVLICQCQIKYLYFYSMKKTVLALIIILLGIQIKAQQSFAIGDDSVYTGFRASRLYHIYPDNQFPPKEYWQKVADGMAAKFDNSQPAGIWIVGLFLDNGDVSLGFPSPGGDYDKIEFASEDLNEDYLDYFDENGTKVWLQVEPGSANIDTLISLVMNRYKHHPSVIGFGIDIEWYKADVYYEGAKVTNEEAQHWETVLHAIDPSYSLFLKHYNTEWMPPDYRGNIFFVDDSQIFSSLQQMVNEYKEWGETFAPNGSGFQFGYNADKHWWSEFNDPPKTIGQAIIDDVPECSGVFWVDFTITEIFPLGIDEHKTTNSNFCHLFVSTASYNSIPVVGFKLNKAADITLVVTDISGKSTVVTDNFHFSKGEHRIQLNNMLNASGLYFVTLFDGADRVSVKYLKHSN